MTLNQQLRFWVIALAAVLALLWLFADILLPFVAGMALAYLLDPVADRLERMGLPRLAATLLILAVFTVIFIVAVVALVPVLASQLDALILRFPEYADRLKTLFDRWSQGWLGRILHDGTSGIESNIGTILQNLAAWFGTFMKSLLNGGLAVVNMVALFVVTPVVAFYMLVDWDNMIARLDDLLPRDHKQTVREIMSQIDEALAGFIRGQTMVCLILGGFYAIGLTTIGLNFGLLIGLGAGLISFVPYVGSISGFLVAISVALVQFWPDWTYVAATAVVFIVGQTIEGNILQPKLVGGHVGLHPVWLMFALFAFGYLFGFVGMLLAVPVAAAIGVVARFAVGKYLQSPLYHGTAGPQDSED
ncbi:MAG: AI-2E family transporter [Rhodobiaceae bacterium]|nr:AI-2E family transporter [Rhodobiaceae bacterium]MCC0013406.1 AI-2E family transporter [Rhodobiaceae bacterium]MCC0018217.1 AI-2E family transporter [Rhodobiaceae bacterium]MCC0050814.1 AI-2E family transporter [Rhodobiaceae bacterium]MCC0060541.1 AI-2E family transporter [Rhodobiaceae bacterium]